MQWRMVYAQQRSYELPFISIIQGKQVCRQGVITKAVTFFALSQHISKKSTNYKCKPFKIRVKESYSK